MSISVICPLYKGEDYIRNLNNSLLSQVDVGKIEIRYILTKIENFNDKSEEILNEINAKYSVIKPEEFSHSLTRENEVYKADGDIIVFITQDIKINDERWLYKLTEGIISNKCHAAYSKQVCENMTIERYTRMKNYPNESRIASKSDIDELGIRAYFYSDAASAIRKSVFIELNGYDQKNLLTNEDMYIAYKLINNGYKIKYCADSEVIHSHEYSYSSLFKRYFDQGVFLKQHEYIAESGAGNSAIDLLKFVIVHSIKEKNYKAFINIIPNFGVRFVADKLGRRYKKLSKDKILKYTSSPNYWIREAFK